MRLSVHLDRDRTVRADLVVLAVGNFPPEISSRPACIPERIYD